MNNTETFLNFFEQHNALYEQQVGFDRSISSLRRYQIVYKHFSRYCNEVLGCKDLPMTCLNQGVIKGFRSYLFKHRKCSANTVWVYTINLKHIVMLAYGQGLLQYNPFAGVPNHFTQVDRGYLMRDELVRLAQMMVEDDTEGIVRDLFLFAAFTGLSYADVKNLGPDNIQNFFDGHLWIVTRRQKTGVASNVRLLEVPLRILRKRADMDAAHIFKIPSNNCCNLHLHNIGQKLGFKQKLTFHIARHTFATMSLDAGMPIESVSRILGHTSIKTTQIYAQITNSKVSADMQRLLESISETEDEICGFY